jgi:hypothetical protein
MNDIEECRVPYDPVEGTKVQERLQQREEELRTLQEFNEMTRRHR